MSDSRNDGGTGLTPVVTGRKRGHQHHVRHSGSRRSNVPADEVIAALRAELLPADIVNSSVLNVDNTAQEDEDVVMESIDDNNRNNNNNNSNSASNSNRNALTELTPNVQTLSPSDLINSNVNTICNQTMTQAASQRNIKTSDEQDINNSVISETAMGSAKKSKSKRDGTRRSNRNRESPSSDQRKRRPKSDVPRGERPPLEGAADTDNSIDISDPTIDIENDPEAAEWSKLRCTSERTEVVAEREYRRQNRRCADYPGLAFGRSIFSSDTMMKLNIIRNELHNIMKTQLKRVRLTSIR